MTMTRPATSGALLPSHLLQALRPGVVVRLATIRRAFRPSRRPRRISATVPALTLWQVDRDELSSYLEHSHW